MHTRTHAHKLIAFNSDITEKFSPSALIFLLFKGKVGA